MLWMSGDGNEDFLPGIASMTRKKVIPTFCLCFWCVGIGGLFDGNFEEEGDVFLV